MKEEPKFHGRVREVGPYRLDELQATLEFYALTGRMANPAIDGQLRAGSSPRR